METAPHFQVCLESEVSKLLQVRCHVPGLTSEANKGLILVSSAPGRLEPHRSHGLRFAFQCCWQLGNPAMMFFCQSGHGVFLSCWLQASSASCSTDIAKCELELYTERMNVVADDRRAQGLPHPCPHTIISRYTTAPEIWCASWWSSDKVPPRKQTEKTNNNLRATGCRLTKSYSREMWDVDICWLWSTQLFVFTTETDL